MTGTHRQKAGVTVDKTPNYKLEKYICTDMLDVQK